MSDQKQPVWTMEDVLTLISSMNEQQQANFMAFAKELKKPSEAEQAKLDKEAAQLRKKVEEQVKLARIEEQSRENAIKNCPHASYHPGTGVSKHLWRAQAHTPAGEKAYFVPVCTRCWTQLPKIYCTPEQLTGGINLDNYASLDLGTILRWAKTQGDAAEVGEFVTKRHLEAVAV